MIAISSSSPSPWPAWEKWSSPRWAEVTPPCRPMRAIVTPAGHPLSFESQSDSSYVIHVPENSTLLIPSGPLNSARPSNYTPPRADAKQIRPWTAATYKLKPDQQPAADAVVWSTSGQKQSSHPRQFMGDIHHRQHHPDRTAGRALYVSHPTQPHRGSLRQSGLC